MSWWEFVPSVLVAISIVFVPGAIVLLVVRSSVAATLFLAPVISVVSIAIGAVFLSAARIPLTIGTFALFHLVITFVAAVVWFVGRRFWASSDRTARSHVAPQTMIAGVLGAAVGATIISFQLTQVLGDPLSISQSYDNIFHLNAIRYIADTGDGSSLTLNSLSTGAPGLNFYPAAWHDATSLVFSVFPASVPAATNAMTFAVAAFAWPASVVFLATTIRPGSAVFAAAAGALSSSFVAFPGLMLKWGILYPNLLGYTLLPAFLALVVLWIRAVEVGQIPAIAGRTALLIVAGATLGLAHPNAVTSAAVLSIPLLAWHVWVTTRQRTGSARNVRTIAFALALAACIAIWAVVRPPADASTWPEKLPSGQAVGEFVANSFNGNSIGIVVSALVLFGLTHAVRTRTARWLVVMWLTSGFLWVVVASMRPGTLRTLITGPWYNDSFRLAALTALPSVLLAALGAAAVASTLMHHLRRAPRMNSQAARERLGVVLTAALAILVAVAPATSEATEAVAREFRETPDSLLITSAEAEVLSKVDEIVPADEVIAVDPWDGSAVVYALEAREVTQFHTLGSTLPQYESIPRALKEAETDPEVCEQVLDGDVRWYLSFEDTLGIGDWARGSFEGFDGLVGSNVVQPVYTVGGVGLYKIVGCDR